MGKSDDLGEKLEGAFGKRLVCLKKLEMNF